MGALTAILRATRAGARSRQRLRSRRGDLEIETIDVLRVDEATLERVRDDLLEVMTAAYTKTSRPGGVDVGPEEYVDHALDRANFSRFNQLCVAYDASGPVGFMTSFVQRRSVEGRELEIIRIGAHVAPAAQDRGLTQMSFIILALRYARAHLWNDVPRYYLGLCLNPVAYRFIVRRAPKLYPSPGCPEHPMMAAVCEAGFPRDRRVGDVVAEPRASRLDPQVRAWVERSDDPLIHYYLARCPRYDEGYGLPIAIELGARDFFASVTRHAWFVLTKRRRRST